MRIMRGVPYLGRTWNRGPMDRAIPDAHGQAVNPPRRFHRDLSRYGAPEPWESGVMVGLGESYGDPWMAGEPMGDLFGTDPDVVFRGCENPGAAAAYLFTTKVDALLKGFTVGAVAGVVGAVALGLYLKKKRSGG